MRRMTSGLLAATMALAFVAMTSTKADASMIAWICADVNCNQVGDVAITDGGAGDGSVLAGRISTGDQVVGGLTVVSTVDQSKPQIGSATSPALDINYNATGTGEVWLYVSDTDFLGLHSASVTNDGNFTGTASISTNLFQGLNNAVNGNVLGSATMPLICATATDSTTPVAETCSGILSANGGSPYSLLMGIHITRLSAGTSTGDALLTVPEPVSMTLFGLGMLGTGLYGRRRRAVR